MRHRGTRKMKPIVVDLSQIRRNLALTPSQRALEHQYALNVITHLEKAGREFRARH